jgi:hypothetical protein
MRHERLVVAGGVAMLVLLSWWYVVGGAGFDAGMAEMGRPPFAALVVMWSLMMMAMMLPSAAPAVLLYARDQEPRFRYCPDLGFPRRLCGFVAAVFDCCGRSAAAADRPVDGVR